MFFTLVSSNNHLNFTSVYSLTTYTQKQRQKSFCNVQAQRIKRRISNAERAAKTKHTLNITHRNGGERDRQLLCMLFKWLSCEFASFICPMLLFHIRIRLVVWVCLCIRLSLFQSECMYYQFVIAFLCLFSIFFFRVLLLLLFHSFRVISARFFFLFFPILRNYFSFRLCVCECFSVGSYGVCGCACMCAYLTHNCGLFPFIDIFKR